MTRLVNRAENWEMAYKAFRDVNFTAYTYDSVKQSLIDYVRTYHGELFNDMIESSELIATIEAFAYVVELLAYRFDMNAHENILQTAQRKETILRLARYLSYNASRNIPARGLLKVTSVSTTESVFDSTGTNLANVAVRWNDPVANNWRERFYLIINRAMAREYGDVSPSDRVQIGDVLFEQYQLNTTNSPVTLPYTASFGGETYEMELVSSILTSTGPEERRPAKGIPFTILFADDGNGDDAAMTGFFCLTKQGTLNRRDLSFVGIPPNHNLKIDVPGINNTDVWLNRVDNQGFLFADLVSGTAVGEWERVDSNTAQNIIFNTLPQRNLYEVETRDDDQIRLVFGDGEFSDIPTGNFELWFRTSEYQRDILIPRSAITDQVFTFTYPDSTGQTQTLRITVSLTTTIQNAASSESIERIRRAAPAAYYAQDRMVNAKDYNSFPLKDNSIFKLRAINRTFAGDSKYIAWHDPTGSFENVKHFGTDLCLHHETDVSTTVVPVTVRPEGVVDNYLTPLLRTADILTRFAYETNTAAVNLPSQFNTTERSALIKALREAAAAVPTSVYVILSVTADIPTWSVTSIRPNDAQEGRVTWWFRVTATVNNGWEVSHVTKRIVATSSTTRFWNTTPEQNVVYDTYRATRDQIVILAANTDAMGAMMTTPMTLSVETARTHQVGPRRGLTDVSAVLVAPIDRTRDGTPDNLQLIPLVKATNLTDDDYVYFRKTEQGEWLVVNTTSALIREYYEQFGWTFTISSTGVRGTPAPSTSLTSVTGRKVVWKYGPAPGATIKREVGRTSLNFLWLHFTPRYHLVDPAPSNLIDMYVMTRGYQQAHDMWLSGRLPTKPQAPTPVELRLAYRPILENKMISDTVIFRSAKIKTIINSRSDPQLRMRLKVIKSPTSQLTNSEVKVRVIEVCREFFDLSKWELGETFHFTELSTVIHNRLNDDIDSVVLVPVEGDGTFGDGFEIQAREDEIIYGFVAPTDIDIVTALDRSTLRQR